MEAIDVMLLKCDISIAILGGMYNPRLLHNRTKCLFRYFRGVLDYGFCRNDVMGLFFKGLNPF